MLLTEQTESLTKLLNDNKTAWRIDVNTPDAKTELDPSLCLLEKLGVYVVPLITNYTSNQASSRRQHHTITETMFSALIVSKVFTELPTSDGVANWSEAQVIVEVRQKAERVIIGWDGTDTNGDPNHLTLVEVDTQPIEELELDNRNFVAMTIFGFEQQVCV